MRKTTIIVATILVVAMLAVTLVACVPSLEKAEENLKAEKYVVIVDEIVVPAAMAIAGFDGCTAVLEAADVSDKEFITIYYFEDSKSAGAFYKEAKENKKEYVDEEDSKDSDVKLGKSGNAVYMGTAAAVKAAN